MDILEEEREKYLTIKGKLEKYRNGLDNSLSLAKQMSDPNMASIMTRVYNRQIYLYERNKCKPYFAKIIFEGSDETTIAYIGRIGFADLNDDDIIVDWRAPISELYYNSKLGHTQFFVDNKAVKGELTLKRQIEFKNGKIIGAYNVDNQLSSDEFLLPYLTGSADNRLKSIVATIQEEQDKIIRIPINKNIIVQGVAGCGKTTVALHRLSYLIYNHREVYKPENYYIISPNSLFKNYISNLLEDLDADLAKSSTINSIVKNIIGDEYKLTEKHIQYEYLKNKNINTNYLKFKTSKSFLNLLNNFICEYQKKLFYKDLVVDGIKILDSSIMYDLYLNCKNLSIEENLEIWIDKVNHLIKTSSNIYSHLNELLKVKAINFKQKLDLEHRLQKGLTKELRSFFDKNINIIDLYISFCKNLKQKSSDKLIDTLIDQTLSNLNDKKLSEDDLGAILYLYARIKHDSNNEHINHVLIDEAQDLSYMEFLGLRNLFPNATFSIFGDLAQSLYQYQTIDSWNEIFEIFNNAELIQLKKSYRTTIEITEDANQTLKALGLSTADNVIRHGKPVQYVEVEENSVISNLNSQISNFVNDGLSSVAIICKDDKEVNYLQRHLQSLSVNTNPNIKLEIMSCMQIKGLEFEGAIIYNLNSYNDSALDQKQLYVAKTRALHSLIINSFKNTKPQ